MLHLVLCFLEEVEPGVWFGDEDVPDAVRTGVPVFSRF
jgi:hypothetical protein